MDLFGLICVVRLMKCGFVVCRGVVRYSLSRIIR